MLGSTVFEVAAGIFFVYFVLSILCTSLNETIAQLLGLRSENLYETLHGLFSGPDRHRFADDLYTHSMINSLSRKTILSGQDGVTPSSIPASAFSTAVMELLGVEEPAGAVQTVNLASVFTSPKYDEGVMKVLRPLINAANNNLDQARQNIEIWFGQVMNRSTDAYKRKAQVMTLLVATALVVVSNADSMMVMDRLWASPVQRAQIEAAAKSQTDQTTVSKVSQEATFGLLGWTERTSPIDLKAPYDRRTIPVLWGEWMAKSFGLLLTIFAVTLGAPFWFDKLSLIMNIRAGGKPADAPSPPTAGPSPGPALNRVPSSDGGK